MSQKAITSFFSKSAQRTALKRNLSELENIDSSNIQSNEKILKLGDNLTDLKSSRPNKEVNGESMKSALSITDSGPGISKNDLDRILEAGPAENPNKDSAISNETSEEIAKRIETNKFQAELKLLCKTLPALHSKLGLSWFQALKNEFGKPYFKKLSKFLEEERSKTTPIFPSPEQVWTWTRECRVDEVKVVILGQDPYHNPGQAHGLCFSVPVGVPPPPSLINMYKELENDIDGFKKPGHGYLIGWARQGVLLLNAVLTVKCRTPNSHKDQGWEKVTDAVIKHLNSESEGIIFLLWGAYAQKKADFVDQKRHYVLKSVHPSPLSASRGFFGCKHFSKCNELLIKRGKTPIDWGHLPTE